MAESGWVGKDPLEFGVMYPFAARDCPIAHKAKAVASFWKKEAKA